MGLPDKLPACPVLVEADEAVLLSRKSIDFTGAEVAGGGLLLSVLLHIGARLHGGSLDSWGSVACQTRRLAT